MLGINSLGCFFVRPRCLKEKGENKQNKEDSEQDFRNGGSKAGYAEKSECAGNKSDDKKYNTPG